MSGYQITINGTVDAGTSNVTDIGKEGGKFYQRNTAGAFWTQTGPGQAWTQAADPRNPATTPGNPALFSSTASFSADFNDGDPILVAQGGKFNAYYLFMGVRYLAANNERMWLVDPNTDAPGSWTPFSQSGGVMHIRAAPRPASLNTVTSQPWVSGALDTSGAWNGVSEAGPANFAQQYGRWQIRCKPPQEAGFWPQFWLAPQAANVWTEIDFFEMVKHVWYYSTHIDAARGSGSGDVIYTPPADLFTAMHTFDFEWTPDTIKAYVDGVLCNMQIGQTPAPTDPVVQASKNAAPFRGAPECYMIASLTIGGWPGDPDGTTNFNNTFDIEWIRAYPYIGPMHHPTYGSGPDILTITLNGDKYRAAPQFRVLVDNVEIPWGIQTCTADHSLGQNQVFTFNGNWGGAQHAVVVNFRNDLYGGSSTQDTNLYVTGMTYNGNNYPGNVGTFQSAGALSFTVSGAAPAAGVTIDPIPDTQTGVSFTVSGSLTGYSTAPTLRYADDSGSALTLPVGATVSATGFSFVHPAISATGAHTVAVSVVGGPTGTRAVTITPAGTATGIPLASGVVTGALPRAVALQKVACGQLAQKKGGNWQNQTFVRQTCDFLNIDGTGTAGRGIAYYREELNTYNWSTDFSAVINGMGSAGYRFRSSQAWNNGGQEHSWSMSAAVVNWANYCDAVGDINEFRNGFGGTPLAQASYRGRDNNLYSGERGVLQWMKDYWDVFSATKHVTGSCFGNTDDMATFVNWSATQSGGVDVRNITHSAVVHTYCQDGIPMFQGGHFAQGSQVDWAKSFNVSGLTSKPISGTEMGHANEPGVGYGNNYGNARVNASYIIQEVVAACKAGWYSYVIYSQMDDGGGGAEGYWGLWDESRVARQSAIALRLFFGIVGDSGAAKNTFFPNTFAPVVTGLVRGDAVVYWQHNSDGRVCGVVCPMVDIYRNRSLNVPGTTTCTVNLGRTVGTVRVYDVVAAAGRYTGAWTTTPAKQTTDILTFTNTSSISFPVAADPMVIEIAA